MPVDFDYKALGRLLASAIEDDGRGYRPNCDEMGIPPSAVSHLKAGQPVATHTVLRACRWLDVDIERFTCEQVKQVKRQQPERPRNEGVGRIVAAMRARGAEGRRA